MAKFGVSTTATEAAQALASHIKGKTVLITGVTKGSIGLETMRAVAQQQPKLVILAARSEDKIAAAAEELRAVTPDVQTKGLQLDLGTQAAVRRAAAEVNGWPSDIVIDVLINNAGIMAVPFELVDGVEKQLATNHVGSFLFTNLVMPRLLQAARQHGSARVVNVSSNAHHGNPMRFDDYNYAGDGAPGSAYNPFKAYGVSKTANVLFAVGLAERLTRRGVRAYSLHPGLIWTNIAERSDITMEYFRKTGLIDEEGRRRDTDKIKWKTLEQGAATSVVAAFDPSIDGESGAYLADCNVNLAEPEGFALDKENAEKLWRLSEELTGEKFEY